MGKQKVAADTGALLSLSLGGLLKTCLMHFEIVIGVKIRSELEEISRMDDELAKAARDILMQAGKDIRVEDLKTESENGELEALELLKNDKVDLLISDDIQFVKEQRDERISFSVILPGILYEKGILSRREFVDAINSIFRKRNWEENLIYLVAKSLIED